MTLHWLRSNELSLTICDQQTHLHHPVYPESDEIKYFRNIVLQIGGHLSPPLPTGSIIREIFGSLSASRIILDSWRREYDEKPAAQFVGVSDPTEFAAGWEIALPQCLLMYFRLPDTIFIRIGWSTTFFLSLPWASHQNWTQKSTTCPFQSLNLSLNSLYLHSP